MPTDVSDLLSQDSITTIEAIDAIAADLQGAYSAADTELYKTNLYSGTDADINTTEKYTDDIDLESLYGVSIDFKFDCSGTSHDLYLYLYKRRDDSWDGDEIAIWSVTVDSDGSEDIYHFTLDVRSYGRGHFRFGMKSSGADTFDIDAEMRTW